MRNRMGLVSIVMGLLLGLLLAVPAVARTTDVVRVVSSEARIDFPTAISFELTAEATDAAIAGVQLLYGTTRGGALTIVELPVTPDLRVEVSHRLDTRVYYFPPGTEITYRWQITDAAGNTLISEPQAFVFHDERFPWQERTARDVTVYWYDGDADFGQELMDVTTRTLERLEREIGAQLDQPVRIYVYANTRDMRSALQSNEVEWVGGQAWPSLGVVIAAIASGDSAEVERIIPHELSHQVLHQATDNPYGGLPVWFDEGLAVHNQEQRDGHYTAMVEDAAREGRLIPLEALASSFPADPEQASLSYAQSREVVEYILATYGTARVSQLVAAFAAATPVEEAMEQVLGRTVDELDAEWRATLPPQTAEPTVVPRPQTAPPERFEDTAPAPMPVPVAQPDEPAWIRWLQALPPWASVGGTALCCIVAVLAAGAALLVGLRLAGVDKQTT